MKFLVAIFLFASSVSAQSCDCGPDGSEIFIAGSSTVEPISFAWEAGYEAKCAGRKVNVTGGGSSVGAARVCANPAANAVDIGNMSREWRIPREANATDAANGKYICNAGDKTRTVTQVPVAIDGITVVVITGGMAGKCIRDAPGAGLSVDQLRWMFTNFTNAQLNASGWDATSLIASDGNEATHRWSEIYSGCANKEVKTCSPGTLSGTYDFFKEHVLPNATEGLANKRGPDLNTFTSEVDEDLVSFIKTSSVDEYGDAIGYFGYSYYAEEGRIFYGVPIKNKGASVWVTPNSTNVENGSYLPFTRRIYMNVLDSSFAKTAPFINYGFSQEGTKALIKARFVPIPKAERQGFLDRVGKSLSCVIAPDVPTPGPTPPPQIGVPTAPVKAPTSPGTPTAPGAAPTSTSCGLFGLSIFCPFTFCGIFGRLLGLCRN